VFLNVQTTFGEMSVVGGKGRAKDCPVPDATRAPPLAVSTQE